MLCHGEEVYTLKRLTQIYYSNGQLHQYLEFPEFVFSCRISCTDICFYIYNHCVNMFFFVIFFFITDDTILLICSAPADYNIYLRLVLNNYAYTIHTHYPSVAFKLNEKKNKTFAFIVLKKLRYSECA